MDLTTCWLLQWRWLVYGVVAPGANWVCQAKPYLSSTHTRCVQRALDCLATGDFRVCLRGLWDLFPGRVLIATAPGRREGTWGNQILSACVCRSVRSDESLPVIGTNLPGENCRCKTYSLNGEGIIILAQTEFEIWRVWNKVWGP